MPIYQIYIAILILVVLLIGGGVGYYVIKDSELIGERQEEIPADDTSNSGSLTGEEKKNILDLLLPSSGVKSNQSEQGTKPGQSSGGSLGSGGSQTQPSQQGGSPSSQGQPPSGESSSSSGDKQGILESLQSSGDGEELSDEEKQSILESLQ